MKRKLYFFSVRCACRPFCKRVLTDVVSVHVQYTWDSFAEREHEMV